MKKPIFMPVLFALLIAGLCLTNLTGCAGKDGDAPDAEQNGPAAPADGPLTEEELRYFNEEFFNGDYMNIRNQFLSSVYDTPADVDLFELFYNGDGQEETMTDEEWAAYEAAGGSVDTDVTKISTIWVDELLQTHTGLSLAETNQVHLDRFIYLPEYDAYYMTHGDTNYRSQVDITSGERKDGLISLYYDDTFFDGGWKCVTLRETGDGGCQFVSNMSCGGPVS